MFVPYWLDFQVSHDTDCECLSSEQLCLFMLCFTFVFGPMIYMIVPYSSCLNASSQVGKGHYQQMTPLKVDVLSAGQELAISYWYRQPGGSSHPPFLTHNCHRHQHRSPWNWAWVSRVGLGMDISDSRTWLGFCLNKVLHIELQERRREGGK